MNICSFILTRQALYTAAIRVFFIPPLSTGDHKVRDDRVFRHFRLLYPSPLVFLHLGRDSRLPGRED